MIPSHRITFSEDQIKEILAGTEEVLRSGQVILGKRTQEFEEAYAEACGRQYGVAVGSDTAAFEMQCKTVDVDDEYVLYPALAFPSILEAVVNAGGKPWFIDGSWSGHLFATRDMVEQAAQQCQADTGQWPKAIILMHTGGLIAREAAEITKWCEDHGIRVLEDAAHSFGAELDGKPAGFFGTSSAFSLYATKPMHAMEGGMIVTNDEELASECRIYRNYGRTQDFGRSVIVRHGYSWRITEIQSLIGMSNLKAMGPNVDRRREIMAQYDNLIDESTSPVWDTIKRLEISDGMKPNGYRYILVGPEDWYRNPQKRLDFKKALKAEAGLDLPGEVYELPTHKQPIWREYENLSFPMAEEFCDRHFPLPVYQSLTDEDVTKIFDIVTAGLEKVL